VLRLGARVNVEDRVAQPENTDPQASTTGRQAQHPGAQAWHDDTMDGTNG
jgi:hypothetical protein